MNRFVPGVICFEHPSLPDLTLKAHIELIAFRYLQVWLNATKRITRASYTANETEACSARSKRSNNGGANSSDKASDLFWTGKSFRETRGDSTFDCHLSRITG